MTDPDQSLLFRVEREPDPTNIAAILPMKSLFPLVIVTACNLDSELPAVDAALGEDAAVGACDPTKPFENTTLVGGVNSTDSDFAIRLSPDELTGYVSSCRTGACDLFVATRNSKDDPFENFAPIDALNTASSGEGMASVTADGLTMYFFSARGEGLGGGEVYTATRSGPDALFSTAPSLVANVNTSGNDDGPYVTPSGSSLYIGTTISGAGDIYVSNRGTGGAFGTPALVGNVSTPNKFENHPVVFEDELTIFFSRCDTAFDATCDIFVARRSSVDDGFGTPTLVDELNTSTAAEMPEWISPDGCSIYFIRLPGDIGNWDIYVARRPL